MSSALLRKGFGALERQVLEQELTRSASACLKSISPRIARAVMSATSAFLPTSSASSSMNSPFMNVESTSMHTRRLLRRKMSSRCTARSTPSSLPRASSLPRKRRELGGARRRAGGQIDDQLEPVELGVAERADLADVHRALGHEAGDLGRRAAVVERPEHGHGERGRRLELGVRLPCGTGLTSSRRPRSARRTGSCGARSKCGGMSTMADSMR